MDLNILEEEDNYELTIIIKKGAVNGGGLPHTAHVLPVIGNEVFPQTADLSAPYFWNEKIVKRFHSLEPLVPVIISFSLYKKRWTKQGHKLVGTVQFPLSDLVGILNKSAVEKQFNLFANRRNVTMNGSLVLSLELKQFTTEAPNANFAKAGAKRQLNIEAMTTRWGEAIAQPNYVQCIGLCLLDDIAASFRLFSEFDKQHFGDNIKLLLVACIAIFLFWNYHNWMITDRNLNAISHDLSDASRMLESFSRLDK